MRYLVLAAFLLLPTYAKKPKQPAPPPTPTQADVAVSGTRGCMTIRNIVFSAPHGYFHTTGVSGVIVNNCGREGTVTIGADFYSRYNDVLTYGRVEKLARVGETSFEAQPRESDAVMNVVNGRITTAFASLP